MAKGKSGGGGKVNKSAISGRFVTNKTVQSSPKTTYKQTTKKYSDWDREFGSIPIISDIQPISKIALAPYSFFPRFLSRFAKIRSRSALSLMKPSASAWL